MCSLFGNTAFTFFLTKKYFPVILLINNSEPNFWKCGKTLERKIGIDKWPIYLGTIFYLKACLFLDLVHNSQNNPRDNEESVNSDSLPAVQIALLASLSGIISLVTSTAIIWILRRTRSRTLTVRHIR